MEFLRNHDFDLFISGYNTPPQAPDPKQLWHTESYYNKGSNFTGFGNAETDALIEDIRTNMDKGKIIEKIKT